MATNRDPRFPPIVVDTVIAVAIFVLGLISHRSVINSPVGDVFSRESDVWNLILIGGQTLPLAFRRRYPGWVLGVIGGSFVVDRVLDYPSSLATSVGVVLALHALGSEWPPRKSLAVGVPLVALFVGFTFLGALTLDSIGPEEVLSTFIATSVPLYIGREVHQRRRRLEALEERAETAEREREEQALRAVAEERARIARELHDVVAHQMTVMTLQAEGARRIAKDGDSRVLEALDTIRESGHEALQEMRRMVGLLRTEPENPALDPQPGVGRLGDLVEQMADAGLPVGLDIQGTPRPLPAGVDVNIYRIVQESLTNVVKHGGPGVTAAVVVRYEPTGLDITVSDDGRGVVTALNGDRAGHGLVGMRERVALLDGQFAAGPRSGGGFQVRAVIPVPA